MLIFITHRLLQPWRNVSFSGFYYPILLSFPNLFLQIFEDGASYHGQLKTKCRTLVTSHYYPLLHPDCPSQVEYMATIRSNAQELRDGGFFLQGGRDKNVLVTHHHLDSILNSLILEQNSQLRQFVDCYYLQGILL
jgi:hypothetical protein